MFLIRPSFPVAEACSRGGSPRVKALPPKHVENATTSTRKKFLVIDSHGGSRRWQLHTKQQSRSEAEEETDDQSVGGGAPYTRDTFIYEPTQRGLSRSFNVVSSGETQRWITILLCTRLRMGYWAVNRHPMILPRTLWNLGRCEKISKNWVLWRCFWKSFYPLLGVGLASSFFRSPPTISYPPSFFLRNPPSRLYVTYFKNAWPLEPSTLGAQIWIQPPYRVHPLSLLCSMTIPRKPLRSRQMRQRRSFSPSHHLEKILEPVEKTKFNKQVLLRPRHDFNTSLDVERDMLKPLSRTPLLRMVILTSKDSVNISIEILYGSDYSFGCYDTKTNQAFHRSQILEFGLILWA